MGRLRAATRHCCSGLDVEDRALSCRLGESASMDVSMVWHRSEKPQRNADGTLCPSRMTTG